MHDRLWKAVVLVVLAGLGLNNQVSGLGEQRRRLDFEDVIVK